MLARSTVNFVGKSRAMTTRFISSQTYTERMEKTGRPVSPHIFIYDFPAAAWTSITNRVTGTLLVGGMTGIGAMSLAGVDVPAYMQYLGDSNMGAVAKFSVAFPFVFHFVCGLRHIQWDSNPPVLTNEGVAKSSVVIAAVTGVASAAIAMC